MELDDETKIDLMEAFQDLHEEVEACLLLLIESPTDAAIHRLFRAIHSVKGNAGILQVQAIVEFSHTVEEVAGALRDKRFTLTDSIAEVLLIAMDRLGDQHKKELFGKQFDYLRIDELMLLYHSLSIAEESEADGIAHQILQFLGAGIIENDIDLFTADVRPTPPPQKTTLSAEEEEQALSDLMFFQELGLQLDNQTEALAGRSIQLFDWAMKMNQLSSSMIDEKQLSAAIYLHDIGMSFLPKELWDAKLDASPKGLGQLVQHPHWGYNYLIRVPGWEEAATIILQHHEHVNGAGYPNGLKGDQIHDGAKILAILDSFFLLTKGRVDQSLRQSTIRAISSVNARIDTEFEGMWVQCFNHVLRSELKAGNI